MTDRAVLFAGDPGDDEGDGYLPAVWLEHDADRHELYVGVGEEIASMAEGVSAAVYAKIAQRLRA